MRHGGRGPCLVVCLLAAAVLVTASVSGCGSSAKEPTGTAAGKQARRLNLELQEVAEACRAYLENLPPAWKSVDRTALAGSLGWGEVARGKPEGDGIALTFDAGAGGEHTPAILDALAAAGVRSTFFLTGRFVEQYPEIVSRMAAEGHELANHSYSHPNFTTLTAGEVASQVQRAEDLVRELTGLETRPYFRFPYGARNDNLVGQVNSLGYISVFWTIDTLDWMPEKTVVQVRDKVLDNACPGAIVLMHCNSPQEAAVLPETIASLLAAGYRPVTLTEVLLR